MNYIALSTSQSIASISYFKNNREFFTFQSGRERQPSFWLNEILLFFERYDTDLMQNLDYIAIDIGPGSFTGIKVGMAFVKGLSLGLGIPLFPINALEGYAHLAPRGENIAVISDAGKGMFYFSLFASEGGKRRCEVKVSLIKPEKLEEFLATTNKSSTIILVDDEIKNFKGTVTFSQMAPLSKGVGIASMSSFDKGKLINAENLRPLYIRLPDAELNIIKQS